jgi:molybdenum cofactor biosynthesis enzyme MoaA
MKIQTMSVVVGGSACNAKCPYCVSKTTGFDHVTKSEPQINFRNFKVACQLAENCGVQTVLLTGKGEPTLYPKSIIFYLTELEGYRFPFKELQTNGIILDENRGNTYLESWRDNGLTTICLSMVHYESRLNHIIYEPDTENYMELKRVIEKIHSKGLMVRLSCILLDGYIDNYEKLESLINYCKVNGVKQLTVRPMTSPKNSEDSKTGKWIEQHHLKGFSLNNMKIMLEKNGTPLLNLAHGATVYDVNGQNICWANCLTESTNTEDIRQIIFYPDGTISYSWQYKGAVLL